MILCWCGRDAMIRGSGKGIRCKVHQAVYLRAMENDGTGPMLGLSKEEVMNARGYDPKTRTYKHNEKRS